MGGIVKGITNNVRTVVAKNFEAPAASRLPGENQLEIVKLLKAGMSPGRARCI
jgi:hypothetical protein